MRCLYWYLQVLASYHAAYIEHKRDNVLFPSFLFDVGFSVLYLITTIVCLCQPLRPPLYSIGFSGNTERGALLSCVSVCVRVSFLFGVSIVAQTACDVSCQALTNLSVAMCMALASLSLDLPIMLELDLSMLGIMKLTLSCSKLLYANLRGSYKLTSAVSVRGRRGISEHFWDSKLPEPNVAR